MLAEKQISAHDGPLQKNNDNSKTNSNLEKLEKTTWLEDYANDLHAAGFADRDINGQGWFMGLEDLPIWQIENLVVELRGNELCLTWHNGHSEITQTARPTPWRK